MRPAPAATPHALLASRIAVVAAALVSAYFVLATISVMWTRTGGFTVAIDPATAVVDAVGPHDARQGVRVGDRVDLARMTFRERGYLYQSRVVPVGAPMTLYLERGKRTQTVTVHAIDVEHLIDDTVATWTRKIVAVLYILTGVLLVWNRPTVMLWGLAAYLIRTHPYAIGPFTSPGSTAALVIGSGVVYAAGAPGLILFASRFPGGRRRRTTWIWDAVAVGVFCWYLEDWLYSYVPLFIGRPVASGPDFTYAMAALSVAILVVLCWKLLRMKRSERAGLGWIVAGYGIGGVLGYTLLDTYLDSVPFTSYWPQFAKYVLALALPASIAYSLVRRRSFGLDYVTNRTLVVATFVAALLATLLIAVWTTSFLSSTVAVGSATFFALLLGTRLRPAYARATTLIDRAFLPQRYEAGLALDRVRESLRGMHDATHVTSEVAASLDLASVAVFERALDGGFVRSAASDWPAGTAWHLLPGDALTRSLENAADVIGIDDEASSDAGLPRSQLRPRAALAIRRAGRVESAVFVGAYRSGRLLDRDQLRSLHGVFDGALLA